MRDLFHSHPAICVESGRVIRTGPLPLALLSGSFNPLHRGHTRLAEAASAHLGIPVHFELSATNVDKPQLTFEEIESRLAQFVNVSPVWVTRAATFMEKAALFPGTAFVVGWDTAVRLVDPRYYGGATGLDAALRTLTERGARFVVGGRLDVAGTFRVWDGGAVGKEFAELFVPLPERDFRVDVSSTDLRQSAPRG